MAWYVPRTGHAMFCLGRSFVTQVVRDEGVLVLPLRSLWSHASIGVSVNLPHTAHES